MLILNHSFSTDSPQQPNANALNQLITAINALKKTIEHKEKSIHEDELWTLEHIAKYCHLSVCSIRKTTAKPTFPEPIALNGDLGQKLWVQKEVTQWVKQNQAKIPKGRARG